jgi:hypothetical protein
MIEKGGDLFYDLMLSPRYYGYFGHLSSKLVDFLLRTFSGQNQTEAWQLKQFFYPAVSHLVSEKNLQ